MRLRMTAVGLASAMLAGAWLTALPGTASAADAGAPPQTVELWSWRDQTLPHAPRATRTLVDPARITPSIPPLPGDSGDDPDIRSAWGCVIMGSVGTTAALAANAENLINVIAGGIVTPANPGVLWIGLAGVVFATFCSLGESLTPLYVHYIQQTPEGGPAAPGAAASLPPPLPPPLPPMTANTR